MDSVYLAVDGGGTKTHAAIVIGSNVHSGFAGASNPQDVGVANAVHEITLAIRASLAEAGIDLKLDAVPFAQTWLGVAGLDSPAEVDALAQALKPALATSVPLLVQNDALLLASPLLSTSATDGLVVIAGTGSLAMSVSLGHMIEATGRRGGLGFLFGDEGSAYHLGREAVRRVAYNRDEGGATSALEAGLLRHYGAGDVEEMVAKAYELDATVTGVGAAETKRKQRIAEGARVVLGTLPDPLSASIVSYCAGELARDIDSLVRAQRLDRSTPLSVGGGVICQPAFRDVFLAELAKLGIRPSSVHVVTDPAVAAVTALAAGLARG
ncbi:hypothetical protein Q5752_002703 [Cryptotrichosporon argae]